MAASNHRLDLDPCYFIILAAIKLRRKRKSELQRMEKKRRRFGFETQHKRTENTENSYKIMGSDSVDYEIPVNNILE